MNSSVTVIPADMLASLIAKAQTEAYWETAPEGEFCVEDYAGGNFDDAYEMGRDDGSLNAIRLLLTELGVDWGLKEDPEAQR